MTALDDTRLDRAPYIGVAGARLLVGCLDGLEVRPWDGHDRCHPRRGCPVLPIMTTGAVLHEIVRDGVFVAWLHPEEAASYVSRVLDRMRFAAAGAGAARTVGVAA